MNDVNHEVMETMRDELKGDLKRDILIARSTDFRNEEEREEYIRQHPALRVIKIQVVSGRAGSDGQPIFGKEGGGHPRCPADELPGWKGDASGDTADENPEGE
jgi:hypothetical protein